MARKRIGALILLAISCSCLGSGNFPPCFQKTLRDGRAVRVTRCVVSNITISGETNRQVLPKDVLVVTNMPAELVRYEMRLLAPKGQQKIWEKQLVHFKIPQAAFSEELRIYDVEFKNDAMAVLYSERHVCVEIVECAESGNSSSNTYELFPQSSLRMPTSGQLIWLKDLYAVVESDSDTSEVFRLRSGQVQKLYPERK